MKVKRTPRTGVWVRTGNFVGKITGKKDERVRLSKVMRMKVDAGLGVSFEGPMESLWTDTWEPAPPLDLDTIWKWLNRRPPLEHPPDETEEALREALERLEIEGFPTMKRAKRRQKAKRIKRLAETA